MIKKSAYLLMLLSFLGGCAREGKKYSFEENTPVAIDESRSVLTKYPSALQLINDSMAAGLTGKTLAVYNINSGKNIAGFTAETISFDSLVNATFQKKYEGKRKYIYDAAMAGGLSEGGCQILHFHFADNRFYIYANALVEVNYINDPEELKKYTNNEKVKKLEAEAGKVDLQIMQYLEFIFVTDNKLKLQKIIPLYDRARLKQDHYTPFYQKGFAVSNGKMYVPVQKESQSQEPMTAKMNCDSGLHAIASYDLESSDVCEYKLSYNDMNFADHTLRDYFISSFLFKAEDGGLIFSNGKEVAEIETAKKIFRKDALERNEWIDQFHRKGNIIVMATHTLDEKKNPTEMEKAYGVDSLSSIHIKIFDMESGTWPAEKKLPLEINPVFLITSDKIIYLSKDKEHYYLNSISYHER